MDLIEKFIPKDTERSFKRTIFLVILGTLILANSIGLHSINQYVLMAICIAGLAISSYKDCKYLLFFLLPLSCALQAFTISVGTILLFLKAPQRKMGYLVPFLFIFLVEVAHDFFSHSVTIIDTAYYGSYLFTFFYLLSDGDNETSPRFCTKMFCYGLMIALFAVIYGMINTFGVEGAFSGMFRDGTIIGSSSEEGAVGVSLNANSVAYYSLALISLLLWNSSKIRMSRVVIFVGVIIGVLAGIISFSRTWILLLALFVLALLFLTKHKRSLIAALIAAMIIVPEFSFFSDVSSGYSNRFSNEDMQTAGNRQGITNRLFEYMNNNPDAYVWGTGVLTYGENSKQEVSPHNATQQILVCTGFLGLFAFAFVLYNFCKRYYSRRIGLISLLPFIICLLDIQTIQFLSPHFLMLPIVATLYCIKSDNIEYE